MFGNVGGCFGWIDSLWGVVGMLLRLYRLAFGCTFLCFCKEKYEKKAARETFRARKVSRDSSKEGRGFRALEARKRNPISVYLKPLPTGRQGLLCVSRSRGRPSRILTFPRGGSMAHRSKGLPVDVILRKPFGFDGADRQTEMERPMKNSNWGLSNG